MVHRKGEGKLVGEVRGCHCGEKKHQAPPSPELGREVRGNKIRKKTLKTDPVVSCRRKTCTKGSPFLSLSCEISFLVFSSVSTKSPQVETSSLQKGKQSARGMLTIPGKIRLGSCDKSNFFGRDSESPNKL